MKTTLLMVLILISLTLFSQEENLKEQITNNWMYWSVSSARTENKPVTRVEEKREPAPDFIISDDGTFNIRFENLGKGTWRLEGDFIFLWGKDSESQRTKLVGVLRVDEVNEEKMKITAISPTKSFDTQIEVVPFN